MPIKIINMAVKQIKFTITLKQDEFINLSKKIELIVRKSRIKRGICNIFSVGATSALITTEYEPGHVKDLYRALEILAPKKAKYKHHDAWKDDNGPSHVKAAFLQHSISIPISEGELMEGTWQNIILFNLDTKERNRDVIVTLIGE